MTPFAALSTVLHKDRMRVVLNINQSFILSFNVRNKGHASRLRQFKYPRVYCTPCLWQGEMADQNAELVVEIVMLVQPEITHTDPHVGKVSVLSVCE